MGAAVHKVAGKAGAKLRSLLRSRKFYTIPDMFRQYKAHILSQLEFPTPAIFHASNSVLESLDSVQKRFLREMGVTERDAFLNLGLAPLSL
jgi:hypothetical protein